MSSMLRNHCLCAALASLFFVGCGAAPKPVVKQKVVQKKKLKFPGIPDAASSAFQDGVVELQKSPPNYRGGVDAFKRAVDAFDRYSVAWLNLAYSYEKLGRHSDAADAYRKLIYKEKVVDRTISLALGRALLLSGSPDQAIIEFESVLRKHKKDLQARNNLAAAYLKKGDTATSLRYVKEVLAVQPKNKDAIINLGLLYLKDKKLYLAELMFNKALGYDKNDARAHNNLGLTFYALNQVPQAVVSFEKAIALDPTMDEARLNLASVLLDYLDYSRALVEFQAVRARFPNHYVAMIGEANSLYGVGKFKEAVALYEETFNIRKDNPEAYLRAGKIYEEQLNSPDKALVKYLRYKDVAKTPNPKVLQSIQFLQMAKNKKKKKAAKKTAPKGEKATVDGAEKTADPKADKAEPKSGGADAPTDAKKDEAGKKEPATKDGGSESKPAAPGDTSGGKKDDS